MNKHKSKEVDDKAQNTKKLPGYFTKEYLKQEKMIDNIVNCR